MKSLRSRVEDEEFEMKSWRSRVEDEEFEMKSWRSRVGDQELKMKRLRSRTYKYKSEELTVSSGDPAFMIGESDINPRSSITFNIFADSNLNTRNNIFQNILVNKID